MVVDVSISVNRILFKSTINEIFQMYNIKVLRINPTNKIININVKWDEFLGKSLLEIYQLYLNHSSFKENIYNIRLKFGDEYTEKLIKISKNMINYFTTSMPYVKHKIINLA